MKFKISDLASLNKKGKRNYNEDYLYPAINNVTPDLIINKVNNEKGLLLMVCDGVGGSVAGDQASRKLCELFPKVVQKKYESYSETEIADMPEKQHQKLLGEVLEEVESQIDEFLLEAPQFRGMATTLTFLYIVQDKAIVGWVGDSRVYRFRDAPKKEEQVKQTEDHSLVVQLWKGGRIQKHEMRNHPRNNVILQAISGSHNPAKIDVSVWDVKEKDLFLLCTDGILEGFDTYEALEDEVLSSLKKRNKLDALKDIIDKKCDEKAKDNYTMHLAQVSIDDTIIEDRLVIGGDSKPSKIKKFFSPKWRKLHIAIGVLFVAILSMVGYYIYNDDSMPSSKDKVEKDCLEKYQNNLQSKNNFQDSVKYVIRSSESLKDKCLNLKIRINEDISFNKNKITVLKKRREQELDTLRKNRPNSSKIENIKKEIKGLEDLLNDFSPKEKGTKSNKNNDKPIEEDDDDKENSPKKISIDTTSTAKLRLYKAVSSEGTVYYEYVDVISGISSGKKRDYIDVKLVAVDIVATKKKTEKDWTLRVIKEEKWIEGKEYYPLIENNPSCPNYAMITRKNEKTEYINSKDIKEGTKGSKETPTSEECGNSTK